MTLVWECPHCGNRQDFTWEGLPPGPIVCEKCKGTTTVKEPKGSIVVVPTIDEDGDVGVKVEGTF